MVSSSHSSSYEQSQSSAAPKRSYSAAYALLTSLRNVYEHPDKFVWVTVWTVSGSMHQFDKVLELDQMTGGIVLSTVDEAMHRKTFSIGVEDIVAVELLAKPPK